VVAATVVLTLVYSAGIAVWEDRPRPLYQSLEVVVQSVTTTGYGGDAPWQTPQINALVILMQLTGIGLILTGTVVYAFSTRFRTEEMGKSKDDADEPSDNG